MTAMPKFVALTWDFSGGWHVNDSLPKGCTVDEKTNHWIQGNEKRKIGSARYLHNGQAGLLGVFTLSTFEGLQALLYEIRACELRHARRGPDDD